MKYKKNDKRSNELWKSEMKKIKKDKNRVWKSILWRKGSLTVEASFIVPMAFMIVALMLVLCFFVHNRVYYSCAAYEAAIGGNEKDGDQAAKAEDVANKRIAGQSMPGTRPAVSVNYGSSSTTVEFSGQEFPAFHAYIPSLQVSKTVKKVRPEKTVRLLWAAGS